MAWAFGLTMGASSFIVASVLIVVRDALEHQRDDFRKACHEVSLNALSDVGGYFVVIAFIGCRQNHSFDFLPFGSQQLLPNSADRVHFPGQR